MAGEFIDPQRSQQIDELVRRLQTPPPAEPTTSIARSALGDTALGRVYGAAEDVFSDLYEAPIGVDRKSLGPFIAQTTEDVGGPLGLVKTFNEVLLRGTAVAGDFGLRAVAGTVLGGLAAVGQAAQELGMSQTNANRLIRDLLGGLDALAVGALSAPARIARGAAGRAARRAARKRAEAPKAAPVVEAAEPSVPADHIRLYRGVGQNLGDDPSLPFFTTSKQKAATYGEVAYVDVPRTKESMARFAQGHGGPDEFVTDASEVIKSLKPLTAKPPPSTVLEAADVLRRAEESGALDRAIATLPMAEQATARQKLKSVYENATEGLEARLGVPLREAVAEATVIEQEVSGAVARATEEFLSLGQVRLDPGRKVSDQMYELLLTDRLGGEEFFRVLDKHKLKVEDMATLWGGRPSAWGRQLNALSLLRKRFSGGSLAEWEEARRASGLDAFGRVRPMWQRGTSVWRALLVSQLATAVRNAEVQGARVGLDVMQHAMDRQVRRVFLPRHARSGSPTEDFAVMLRLAHSVKTKKLVDRILGPHPAEWDSLFLRYSSDVAGKTGGVPKGASPAMRAMAGAERSAHFLNFANRGQEWFFRRGIFAGSLDRKLAQRGLDLDEIVKSNRLGAIRKEELHGAIEEALEFTFAKNFNPFSRKRTERVAASFVDLVNNIPGAAVAVPFPRFMMNSLKFQWEWSPFGALKYLSKSERAAFRKGDVKRMSRATIGLGLFLTAWQLRERGYIGERWYKIKFDPDDPNSKTFDARVFFPLAVHLFAADLLGRAQEGTIGDIEPNDIARGILSMGVRAGAGVAIVDNFLELLFGTSGDPDEAWRRLKEKGGALVGETLAGFATPLQQLRDLVAEFDEEERVVRFAGTRPMIDPTLNKIPFLSRLLPEAESPTRGDPMLRESLDFGLGELPRPFNFLQLLESRQFSGLSTRTPNPAERELGRLGFRYRDVLPTTGDRIADQLVARHLGPLVEDALGRIVAGQVPAIADYNTRSPAVQSEILKQVLNSLHEVAFARAAMDDPEMFRPILMRRALSRRQQRILQEQQELRQQQQAPAGREGEEVIGVEKVR